MARLHLLYKKIKQQAADIMILSTVWKSQNIYLNCIQFWEDNYVFLLSFFTFSCQFAHFFLTRPKNLLTKNYKIFEQKQESGQFPLSLMKAFREGYFFKMVMKWPDHFKQPLRKGQRWKWWTDLKYRQRGGGDYESQREVVFRSSILHTTSSPPAPSSNKLSKDLLLRSQVLVKESVKAPLRLPILDISPSVY